jgi:hypothetical protein
MKRFYFIFSITLIIIILSFIIMSNIKVKGHYADSYFMSIYDEIMENYAEQCVDHFPKIIDGRIYAFTAKSPIERNYFSYLYLATGITSKQRRVITLWGEKWAIEKHRFTDSCLMIVENFKKNDPATSIESVCSTYSLPLPLPMPLPDYYTLTDYGLPSEFYHNATIYVLGAERGDFFRHNDYLVKGLIKREDHRLKSEDLALPAGWEHGYSKGIVISGKYVLYWVGIW